jgi:uncharacterized protein YeaO (DUF488 family)
MITLQRAYDNGEAAPGRRFLVDRIWPRGVKKEQLAIDGWLKDVAPSDELRRWFGHDPQKWPEFQERYTRELDQNPQAWQPLLAEAQAGDITLLYGARDTEHNEAVALKTYLEQRLAS